MHGFPDNVHLYDRLSPYLSPPRRVVLFDFLGWGSSDKPSGYPYTADNQVGDPNLNFNFIRDITPVACIARTPFVMVVRP
jgi:pimeloyl-ACP methyl ester carboxylesterase